VEGTNSGVPHYVPPDLTISSSLVPKM